MMTRVKINKTSIIHKECLDFHIYRIEKLMIAETIWIIRYAINKEIQTYILLEICSNKSHKITKSEMDLYSQLIVTHIFYIWLVKYVANRERICFRDCLHWTIIICLIGTMARINLNLMIHKLCHFNSKLILESRAIKLKNVLKHCF
jgi:hypothetical protein